MEFENQVAIVTGASRGIGREVAIELASNGAFVVINYTKNSSAAKNTLSEIEKAGGKGKIVRFDVSDYEDVQKKVADIIEELGGIHILVNNAGITKDGLFLRMSEQEWDKVFEVNIKGLFNCTKAVVRTMIKQRYGRIINISSVVGEMGNAGQINYSSAKSAILGFTKSTAKEFGSRGVTVNAVSPGFVETDITKDLPEKIKEKYLEAVPLKRFGNAKDISNAVAFLASSKASYITGEVIRVNGGMYM
ncbi:MAG: 3-oxoacyl-[acyl-carrier-protein] reductase [Thermodesulfobacteriota bacterium]